MAKYDNHKKYNTRTEDDLVGILLRLPVKNLESRIRLVEQEIKTRQGLSDTALLSIGNQRLRLEDKLYRLRYISVLNETFIVNREFLRQIIQLEEDAIREAAMCFQDLSRLREKLQAAREELAVEKQKLELLEEGK